MNPLFEININSLPGPHDIHRQVLKNGITILTRENFQSPSVVISGFLSAGSLFDPPEKVGLAYFTSMALMRGTASMDFQTLYDRLESAGASLGFAASVHNTNFGGKALAEDLPLLISTLAECLKNPTFPEIYLNRLKAQILSGLTVRAQDTNEMAALTFDRLLFGDHPYARPEDGYIETIQRIQRDDLVEFHNTHYGPENLIIVVVGAVNASSVFDLVEKELGSWENPQVLAAPRLPSIMPPSTTIREHVTIPGKSQTNLVMGTLGPRRNAPEYLTATLGNNILGQFGMMGRIGDSVREKAGLAYDAYTSLNSWIESGSWEVAAGVNPENLEKAIQLILQELKRFTSEPVSQNELEDSQANFIGRLPLSLESNSGVANSILNLERFNLGLDYLQTYPEKVSQITPEAILETARAYIEPEKLVIVSAGIDLQKGNS
jgi:zinc protease